MSHCLLDVRLARDQPLLSSDSASESRLLIYMSRRLDRLCLVSCFARSCPLVGRLSKPAANDYPRALVALVGGMMRLCVLRQ